MVFCTARSEEHVALVGNRDSGQLRPLHACRIQGSDKEQECTRKLVQLFVKQPIVEDRYDNPRRLLKFGRGGGDRKDELLNKACVLYALQPPLLSNWNKWNKREARLPWARTIRLQQLHQLL